MSSPPQAPPQGQAPVMTIEQTCTACGSKMNYTLPIPRIFNAIDVSIISYVHNRPDICPSCKAMFLPVISGIDVNGCTEFVWKGVSGKKQPMIIGGNDEQLKRAIAEAQFAEKLKQEGN